MQQLAADIGIPTSVVEAQVNEESGFNAGAVSPAGAEGEFQFLPGTYAAEGGTPGTEFNVTDESKAYAKYMKSLLQWSGGDVRKALAAYNAGQGNWQAGLGYANTILAAAGQPSSLSAPQTQSTAASASGLPGFSWPGEITSFFSDAQSLIDKLMWLIMPSSWLRIGAFLIGVGLLLFAIHALIAVGEGQPMFKMPNVAPVPV